MALPSTKPSLDIETYMLWEDTQEDRHEFLAGEVFAMSGGTDAHYTITLNFASALKAALSGSPCRAFITGMKVCVDVADAVFYPDVFVTCDVRDKAPEANLAKFHPAFIAEVLSDSTAAYDRGDKFIAYRSLPSLMEYLLIDPDHQQVELFRKGLDGLWVLHAFAPGDSVQLASVEAAISWERLYRNVD